MKNTPLPVAFSTLFSVCGNALTYGLSWGPFVFDTRLRDLSQIKQWSVACFIDNLLRRLTIVLMIQWHIYILFYKKFRPFDWQPLSSGRSLIQELYKEANNGTKWHVHFSGQQETSHHKSIVNGYFDRPQIHINICTIIYTLISTIITCNAHQQINFQSTVWVPLLMTKECQQEHTCTRRKENWKIPFFLNKGHLL